MERKSEYKNQERKIEIEAGVVTRMQGELKGRTLNSQEIVFHWLWGYSGLIFVGAVDMYRMNVCFEICMCCVMR